MKVMKVMKEMAGNKGNLEVRYLLARSPFCYLPFKYEKI